VQVCSKCNKEKNFSEFHKDKSKRLGFKTMCKLCTKKYRKVFNKTLGRQWAKKYIKRPNVRFKLNAYNMQRYCKRLKATPPWLSEEHKKEIENIYWLRDDLTRISGEKYHVDHIVPLRGKNVCGLHVPWNLQILPSDINMSKGNRLLAKSDPIHKE